MVFAYSCTAVISIEPAILVPQWQINTPILLGFFSVTFAAGAGAADFAAFGSFFAVVSFLVFLSAMFSTSLQHLLQERLAANRMKIEREILRTHSLCQSEQFAEVQYGQVVCYPEFLRYLDLATVKLQL